jgi:hypothetical protein
MTPSQISFMPQFYDRYIQLVPEMDIIEALETQYGENYIHANIFEYERLGDKVYAPNKWTIKDILQHAIDTERIFACRALRLARFDKTPLPGYDENDYAAHSNASRRKLMDLIYEFVTVRKSTTALFKSFDSEQLLASGQVSNIDNNVLAIGFSIVGHWIHHKNVILDRYIPLLKKDKVIG